MILRIFRAEAQPGQREAFKAFFLGTAAPLVRSQPGIVSVTLGLPREETSNEFCMVMVWETVEALKAFAGDAWQEPHVHPDEAGIVARTSLLHYDVPAV